MIGCLGNITDPKFNIASENCFFGSRVFPMKKGFFFCRSELLNFRSVQPLGIQSCCQRMMKQCPVTSETHCISASIKPFSGDWIFLGNLNNQQVAANFHQLETPKTRQKILPFLCFPGIFFPSFMTSPLLPAPTFQAPQKNCRRHCPLGGRSFTEGRKPTEIIGPVT